MALVVRFFSDLIPTDAKVERRSSLALLTNAVLQCIKVVATHGLISIVIFAVSSIVVTYHSSVEWPVRQSNLYPPLFFFLCRRPLAVYRIWTKQWRLLPAVAEKTVVMLLSGAEIVLFQRFLIDARQTVQRQKETINACSCIGSTQYCFSSGNMILIHDMQVYLKKSSGEEIIYTIVCWLWPMLTSVMRTLLSKICSPT